MSEIFSHNIRKIEEGDRKWIRDLLVKEWKSPLIVTKGIIHHADSLPGFIAEMNGNRQGLLIYRIEVNQCEIVTLNSVIGRRGIGSALIDTVKKEALTSGCKRLWFITTNDNVDAIRFYQKKGFRLVAVHENAVEESRKLKPEIPITGINGIPIRDEIEMELIIEGKSKGLFM